MKILKYQYSGIEWEFQETEFQDVNLIVGDSGTGKTRLLNTIFNLGSHVAKNVIGAANSNWNLTVGIEDKKYSWKISTDEEENKPIVVYEELYINDHKIIERDKTTLSFQGNASIKPPKNEMAISTLREEDLIKPLHEGFSRILRRSFFRDDVERNAGFQAINANVLRKIGESQDLNELYKADLGLNLRLSLLKTHFEDVYEKIVNFYMQSFDFITEVKIISSDKLESIEIPLSSTPVFCVLERNVKKWIRLDELSSGLQKALLIITDLLALPEDIIYLIDEYENSLGISAINVLPDVLLSSNLTKQVFITSHHPYIITKFPVENWYVAHRNGSKVSFAYGDRLVERYNASKQDKYFQLVNDPFYSEGIE